MDDDRPAPPWLAYGLMLASGIALLSLVLMGLWVAFLYLAPASWLP